MGTPRRFARAAIILGLLALVTLGAVGVYGVHRYRTRPERHRRIARELEAKAEWTMAARHWRVYLSTHPDDAATLVHYGKILLKAPTLSADTVTKSAGAFRRATQLDSSNRDAHVELMNLLLGVRMYDEALHVADKLWLSDHPDDADALGVKARSLQGLGRRDEALEAYRTLLQKQPDAFDGWQDWLELARRTGESDDAIQKMLQEAVARNRGRVEPLLIRFNDAMRMGNVEWAKANLLEAEALAANDPACATPDVVLARATLLVREGQLREAEALFTDVADKHPAELRGHMGLGLVLGMQDRNEEALAAFVRGLSEVEDRRELLSRAADMAAALGKDDQARTYIEELRTRAPRSAWLDYLDGRLLLNGGRPSEAAGRLERAVKALPDQALCHFVLGRCYRQLGINTLAWSAFHRAARLAPGFVAAQKAEAQVLLAMGRPGIALKCLRAWIDQNPSDYGLLMLTVRSLLAAAGGPAGGTGPAQTAEILGLLDRAADLKPEAIEPVEFRAETWRLRGKHEKGARILRAAIEKRPDDVRLHQALGHYHVRQGDREAVGRVLAGIRDHCGDTVDARVVRATLHATLDEVGLAKALLTEGIGNLSESDAARAYFNLGLILLGAQQPREALASFITAAEYRSDNLGIHRAALNLAHTVGSDEDLTRLLAAVRRIDGEEGAVWRLEKARYLLTGAADRDPRPREAQAILEDIVENRRRNWPEALMLLGVCQEMLDDLSGACGSYQSAISLDPDNLRNHVLLVDVLYRLGQFDAADDALAATASASRGDDADVLRLRIKQALRRGSETQTMELLEQYLTMVPHDAAGHIVFGHICNQAGQYGQAQKALLAAIELSPDSLLARTQLLRTYVYQGQAAKALAEAQRYVQSNPGAAAQVLLARVHGMLHDREACEAACAKAVERATPEQKAGLLVLCGRLLSPLGSELAVTYYEKALEIDPNRSLALEGLLRIRLGEPDGRSAARALEMAKAWEAREPDRPTAALFVILAEKAMAGGAWSESLIRRLNRIVEVYPRAIQARRTLAAAFLATGQISRAQDQVDYLLGSAPSDRIALGLSVEIGLQRKSHDRARAQARKLVRLYPADVEAAVTLGRCLHAASETEEAEKVLRKVLQADLHPDVRTRAHLALANVYLVQDRWPEAQSIFEPLLDNTATRYQSALLVASLAQTPQAHQRATEYVADLIGRHAPDPELLYVQAKLLSVQAEASSKAENVSRIRDLYRQATAAAALAPRVYADWGSFELSLRNSAQAEAAFRKALELRPTNVVALNNLAYVVGRTKDRLDEALKLIDKAVAVAPWNSEAHHTRGQILHGKQEYTEAALAYRRAIVTGKQGAAVYLDLAKALLAAEDPYEARRAAELGLEQLRDGKTNDARTESLRNELKTLSGRT